MALMQHCGMNIIQVGTISGIPIKILPGVNEFSGAEFSLMESHPSFIQRVKDGIFKILDDGKSSSKKSIADMKEMILKIFDKKLLNKIIKTDDRSEVIESARSQLDLIVMKNTEVKDDVEHFN